MARLVFALPFVALLASSAHSQDAPGSLEVRFCGPQPLRTYSLSAEANLQSVLLPYEGVEIPFVSFAPRPVQSGDVVIAK